MKLGYSVIAQQTLPPGAGCEVGGFAITEWATKNEEYVNSYRKKNLF